MLTYQRWWVATCVAAFALTLCDVATAQFTCEVDNVVADDQAVNQWYGRSVSIATKRAAIGAPRDAQGATDAGAVYILERTGLRATDPTKGWVQFAKLMADDGAAGDRLGFSVAISEDGNTVVAGAYRRAEGGVTNSGAAYVFVRDGDGNWSQDRWAAFVVRSLALSRSGWRARKRRRGGPASPQSGKLNT